MQSKYSYACYFQNAHYIYSLINIILGFELVYFVITYAYMEGQLFKTNLFTYLFSFFNIMFCFHFYMEPYIPLTDSSVNLLPSIGIVLSEKKKL